MDANKNAELALVEGEKSLEEGQRNGGLLPVVALDSVIERKHQLDTYIQRGLVKDKDYGIIPGTNKPSLLKPGAEQVLAWFNCYADFRVVEESHDPLVINEYEKDEWSWYQGKRKKTGNKTKHTSQGRHTVSIHCHIISRASGLTVGAGVGSCSTMESKYIDRPNDSENTVLKMAKKRAMVDAVLSTFALSDRFTQDVEEFQEAPEQPLAPPTTMPHENVRLAGSQPPQTVIPGVVNVPKQPDDSQPDSGEPTMRSKIAHRIVDLVGSNAADITDFIEMITEWRNDAGQVKNYGVRDLDLIKYDVRPGKKVSQAQMVYSKIKDGSPEEAKAALAAWRKGRSEFER